MTADNKHIADRIIAAMQAEIDRHGLELMETYPNDLLVHDRMMLERAALPGAKIAWMCGDCHTHLVALGVLDTENENVECLLNLSNNDRFYLLTVGYGETFALKEVGRDAFKALRHTPVPYKMEGGRGRFHLTKGAATMGIIELDSTVEANQQRSYQVTITPSKAAGAVERFALELNASRAAIQMAGTLFCKTVVNWAEPVELA